MYSCVPCFCHNSNTYVLRDVILYATLRGCISVGDALIDVWFSLLGLPYQLAYTYKALKKLFISCTVDFKLKTLSTYNYPKKGVSVYTFNK